MGGKYTGEDDHSLNVLHIVVAKFQDAVFIITVQPSDWNMLFNFLPVALLVAKRSVT